MLFTYSKTKTNGLSPGIVMETKTSKVWFSGENKNYGFTLHYEANKSSTHYDKTIFKRKEK